MKATISKDQQIALLRKQGQERLNRTELSDVLGLSRETVRTILDSETPLTVSAKTFTAVNDWLISELAK